MSGKAKVVLTDYVWESLDVERNLADDMFGMPASDLESREKIVLLSNRDHGVALVDGLCKHLPGQLPAGDPLIFVLSEDDMRL